MSRVLPLDFLFVFSSSLLFLRILVSLLALVVQFEIFGSGSRPGRTTGNLNSGICSGSTTGNWSSGSHSGSSPIVSRL